MNVDDLTPRERIVFMASCRLEDASPDGRTPLMHDPEYGLECENLTELGWLERVEHGDELAGYKLTSHARASNAIQLLIEEAESATN
jgi:hypothetical protein